MPIPELAVDATAEVIARAPGCPPERGLDPLGAQAGADEDGPREAELRLEPKTRAKATLKALVEARRTGAGGACRARAEPHRLSQSALL